jgi:hypothetical protein
MVVALPAVALTLIYGILKFPNFAIGAMLTAGAYLALAFNVYLSLPVLYAAAAGAAVFAVIAVAIDQAVFRPLRERSAITLLVASMGVSFVLENIARFIFGNGARSFELPLARPKLVFGLRINNEQIVTADGARWLAWRDVVVWAEKAEHAEVQSVGRDVTDRIEAERALAEARDAAEAASGARHGAVEFQSTGGQPISGIGLRFSQFGSFTSFQSSGSSAVRIHHAGLLQQGFAEILEKQSKIGHAPESCLARGGIDSPLRGGTSGSRQGPRSGE